MIGKLINKHELDQIKDDIVNNIIDICKSYYGKNIDKKLAKSIGDDIHMLITKAGFKSLVKVFNDKIEVDGYHPSNRDLFNFALSIKLK